MSAHIWAGRYYRGAMRDRRATKRTQAEQRNAATAAGNRAAARRRRAAGMAKLRRDVDALVGSIAPRLVEVGVNARPVVDALARVNRELERRGLLHPDHTPTGQPVTAAQQGQPT